MLFNRYDRHRWFYYFAIGKCEGTRYDVMRCESTWKWGFENTETSLFRFGEQVSDEKGGWKRLQLRLPYNVMAFHVHVAKIQLTSNQNIDRQHRQLMDSNEKHFVFRTINLITCTFVVIRLPTIFFFVLFVLFLCCFRPSLLSVTSLLRSLHRDISFFVHRNGGQFDSILLWLPG